MSEAEPLLLYRKLPGSRSGGRSPVVCALRFTGDGDLRVEAERVVWTPRACALLKELHTEGRAGTGRGKALPYASLRAAIATLVPDATLLERDLGLPWSESPRPFLDVPLGKTDLLSRLEEAMRLWVALALRPWAADIGAPEECVDALDRLGPDAFAVSRRSGSLEKILASDGSFAEKRDAILQRVAICLDGQELFEGQGPAWRIVRAQGGSNEIEFISWPTKEHDALQSMVARLTVETIPFSSDPIITVRASRRRWLADLPKGSRLFGQRGMGVTMMSREPGSTALEVNAPVRSGNVEDPVGPEFIAKLLHSDMDLASSLKDHIARGAAGNAFVGIAYSPKVGGSHPLGAGVSTRDQLDLFDAVASALEGDGFAPLPYEDKPILRSAPKRPPEYHKAIEAEALLADVAVTIGRNDLDDDASIAAAWESLGIEGAGPAFSVEAAQRARLKLEELREVNAERIARAFGDTGPRVVVLARTEAERRLLNVILVALFGRSIRIEERPLPADVHGARPSLPSAERKPRERFEARVAAWRPLAKTLKAAGDACHVLVQAADWYERKLDDPVNKLAGRYSLAAEADANVQYLRPREAGQRGFANYLQRVQAAIYDLVFGHSGLVSAVGPLLVDTFPDEGNRPTSILGLSVLTQARTRLGGRSGRLCLATRIEASTNRTTAKVGWFDGEMRWTSAWEPLFAALKRIASPDVSASLGSSVAEERTNFQLFVRGILDGCAEEAERPLVLVDSTSAAGLWPWLNDTRLGPELTIGAERLDVTRRWPSARLVRVRLGHAARVGERKTALYQQIDAVTGEDVGPADSRYAPTITTRTVQLSGEGRRAHYWSTGGYFQMSLPRGLSVYRRLATFVPVAKLDKKIQTPPGRERYFSRVEIPIFDVSYRLPNPIEITVALSCEGDDPDKIAHFVASLREGYGHTAAATSLPAPLFFEAKARDYMTRFGLDAAEDEDDCVPEGQPAEAVPASSNEDTDESAAEADAGPVLNALDRRAWRKLIDNKGISLMDSTSLSSSNPSPDDEFSVEGVPPISLAMGHSPSGLEDDDDDEASEEPTARRPVIELPSFVTVDWLRQAVNVPNASLRAMHQDRDEIRRISGFTGWPQEKPNFDRFLELLIEGMRYPRFLALLTQAAKRRMAQNKAQQWTPFLPIWKRAYSEAGALRRALGESSTALYSQRRVAELLADAGQTELAMGNILQQAYAFKPPVDLLDLIESDARFSDVRNFVRDVRREVFHQDYQWFGDMRSLAVSDEEVVDASKAEADREEGSGPDPELESVRPSPIGPSDSEEAIVRCDVDEGSPNEEPAEAWVAAMSEIAAVAASADLPDGPTLKSLEQSLEDARNALAAFEAARPKLVDASSTAARTEQLIQRVESILADAAQPEAQPAVLGAGILYMLSPETIQQLETELADIEASVNNARVKLDEAREIMRSGEVSRLDEAVGTRTDAVAEARDASQRLKLIAERLTQAEEVTAAVEADALITPSADEPGEIEEQDATSVAPEEPAPSSKSFSDLNQAAGPVASVTGELDSDDASLEEPDWEIVEDEPEALGLVRDDGDEQLPVALGPLPTEGVTKDPIKARIAKRVQSLISERQFGLAYHLHLAASAAQLDDELSISASELRLAAMSRHVNHAALQGSELVHRLLTDARIALDALEDQGSCADARRILALGYIVPFALYHVDPEARLALDALRHVADGLGKAAHALREAIAMPVGMGLNLTPAMMRLAGEEAEEDRYVQDLTSRLLSELEDFATKTYKFHLGVKLRNVLSRSDGELGKLQERIAQGGSRAVAAAREFAANYSERSAILDLLEDVEKRTRNYKYTGIDGIARDRMVGAIQSIAAICAEYAEAKSAAPAFRGTKQNIQKVRTAITGAVTELLGLLASRDASDPVTKAATAFTVDALNALLISVKGSASVPGAYDHLFALHGPLLWVGDLEFGQSWLPAPYVPEQVLGAILDFQEQSQPRDALSLGAAVENRFKAGSHIAAAMLIDAASFYGMPASEARPLSEARGADAVTRRDALAVELRDARLMVDRLQRMGGGTSQDEAQSLLSLLDRINPDELPVIVPPESRSENPEGQQILDFKAAYGVIADVRARVTTLLQQPRDELLARISSLSGQASDEDLEKVRGLVSRDDLLTAAEYIDFLQDGRALPESASPNPRFHAFFPQVPNELDAMAKADRDRLSTRVLEGQDVGSLLFSRVPNERRRDAADGLEKWRELKRAVTANLPDADVISKLAHLLGQFGIHAKIRTSNARTSRRFYTADMRFDLPLDRESVLLPDFGSLTGGDYRVCIASKMPSEAELRTLQREAGALRLIIFLTDVVTAERRKQLLLSCLESGARLLVIDDAIVHFAISEPELRGLTLFECAQPFSFAEPYRDYGNAAVPSEMFFGRATEQRKLYEPHGSCIVYGGRRLGKTALLRHIQAEANDPDDGIAVAYVSILDLGAHAGEEQIWEYMSRELTGIFTKPEGSSERFSEEIRRWLNVDSKRRILVLLDESDRFVQADADKNFVQFVRLQRLMDDTNRRFKFVLAGLHNVTRLVHTENPPLKQIASDPQRIGPLMDEELGDAEALVVKPLAGMGYEFANREDVWRILSYCNYYPVLVQKFCQQLVQQLNAETLRRRKALNQVTSDHIRQALENEAIAREIGETFDYTISKIEDRYALIANIVAERATRDAANGRIGEGMSAVEVRDAAVTLWPKAFREANRLAIVEDLLDEMEGLGVLRRTPGGRWALRSPTILRLLGDDDKIIAKLGEFMDRDAPPAFDPRSMRRRLKANLHMKVSENDVCPLTAGQEHDILRDRSPVTLVFGNSLSSIELVSGALSSIGPAMESRRSIDVSARTWSSKELFLKELRAVSGEKPILHVVDQATDWDANWVIEVARLKPVRKGRARVLFVGRPAHALGWVNDQRTLSLGRELRIIPLQTWSTTLVDHMLQQDHLDPDQFRTKLRSATGGFNRPMQDAFAGSADTAKAFKAKLEASFAKRLTDPALPAELGLVGPMFDLFTGIARYAGANDVTPYEIGEGPIAELGLELTGARAAEFGTLLALLEAQAGYGGEDEDSRPFRLNSLLLAALESERS